MAAGFTLPNENLAKFKSALLAESDAALSDIDLHPELSLDALVTLPELDKTLFNEINKLEPTGEGNSRPIFAAQNISARNVSRIGKHRNHLKLTITDGLHSVKAIGFGLGPLADCLPDQFQIAFLFTENHFRGRKNYQLQILDIQPN